MVKHDSKYHAVKYVSEELNFTITLLCEIIDLNRSSYYKWLKRKTSKNDLENETVLDTILDIHKEVKGIYGYRRLTMNVNRKLNKSYNTKRIYRLIKLLKIECVIRRKRKKYIRSKPQHVAENILSRKFSASVPNEKWLTDLTEFKYGKGKKAYLSAILDLYDNSIVAYNLGNSNNNELVFTNLDIALKSVKGTKPLIHSDRGYQYTSNGFKRKINEAGMTQSMSRVGKCIDNGPMEGFFGILKCEKYYLNKYDNYLDLEKDIEDYIKFYNNKRLQKKLNCQSPVEFRAMAA